jgi:hypothetical protein
MPCSGLNPVAMASPMAKGNATTPTVIPDKILLTQNPFFRGWFPAMIRLTKVNGVEMFTTLRNIFFIGLFWELSIEK